MQLLADIQIHRETELSNLNCNAQFYSFYKAVLIQHRSRVWDVLLPCVSWAVQPRSGYITKSVMHGQFAASLS